ncbi:MAG TPA: WYL domain-containing protein [Mycobacteriales bacterium]|nr:WYL domain-containing protein [Mycobacteriales bacterium]
MSSRRAERLVNLVLCLLSTRQYLTAGRIRAAVPGYEPDEGTVKSDEAFKRMFERDKAELRELGIPLETGRNSVFDVEDGYRIARRDYELPAIDLTPDEAAAVGLATRLWQSAGMAQASRGALRKLRAAGLDVDPSAAMSVEPRIKVTEAGFHPCLDAVRTRRAVRFPYRSAQARVPEDREVEPWGVVSWRGRWYLVGHDRIRAAVRCFRLSRMAGPVRVVGPRDAVTVPDGVDLTGIVAGIVVPEPRGVARIQVRPGCAAGLRRRATVVSSAEDHDVVEIGYADPEYLARWVAGYGANAIVLEPAEVREPVVRWLRRSTAHPPDGEDA